MTGPLILPFNGKVPRVHETAFIAPNATLIGDVTIGPHASVFYGCVLRADINSIVVGARTNIQDNSVLHVDRDAACVLGDDVTVGHMALVHGSALLQRLAAVRGRLSLCADQAAAAKWWLSMPMASVSAEGPMPKALSTRRTSPLMPGCRHQGRACPLRRARMTSNPLIVA